MGGVSLLLTLINIVAILLFGWLILWLKEVTPNRVPQSFPNFWKQDVKTFRRDGAVDENNDQTQETKLRESLEIDGSKNNGFEETLFESIIEKMKQDEDYCKICRLNINSAKLIDPRKTKRSLNSIENDSRIASKSQGIRRSSAPNFWPNFDTMLYNQAKMLIKNYEENSNSQQPFSGTFDVFDNVKNLIEPPKTAPMLLQGYVK